MAEGATGESPTVAVIGGGIAALTTTIHLLELADAARLSGHPVPFTLRLLSPLIPDRDAEGRLASTGTGLGGKAMARHYVGEYDTHHEMHRGPFYGPMMPHRGTIPHGYHVLWEYPHLRRMLGDDGSGLGGLLRPPGGAKCIGSFQGDVDDPAPGGPGIGVMGLCDPEIGLALREETALLFRLRGHDLLTDAGLGIASAVMAVLSPGASPLPYLDVFFAHEIDVELRLALIVGSLNVRRCNPETATIDGRRLHHVEYDEWCRRTFEESVRLILPMVDAGGFVYQELASFAGILRDLFDRTPDVPVSPGRDFDLGDPEALQSARAYVAAGVARVMERLPAALLRLLQRSFRAERTLHFRFAPDATFTSPYSFDAAQAVRSLAFCFVTPRASRLWTADGGQWNRVWLKLYERIDHLAAQNPQVKLRMVDARVTELTPDTDGIRISYGPWSGHAGDLGWPHAPSMEVNYPPLPEERPPLVAQAVIPTMAPNALEAVLRHPAYGDARASLEPLRISGNETLELLVWTREPVEWSEQARLVLAQAAITGLEGPFCLLADYSCGLWSDAAYGEEDPFGEGPGSFAGSILESCGGFEDLYACPTRDDAFGWPEETKTAIRDLLSRPEYFSQVDPRPWPHDSAAWHGLRAAGTWTPERQWSGEAMAQWFVAARWLVWGWFRQLSLIQSLGPRAVRQLADLADRLDPRRVSMEAILEPAAELRSDVRYVLMRNGRPRNRIFSPGAGTWELRHVSGTPIDPAGRIFPAGEWTRNGLDIVCMEAATLSGMRAARATWTRVIGRELPAGAPGFRPDILPPEQWYGGNDPWERGAGSPEEVG